MGPEIHGIGRDDLREVIIVSCSGSWLRRWVGENVVKKLWEHRQEAEVHTISPEF